MAPRCPRNQKRGPDGACYTAAQLKKLTRGGAFRRATRARDSGLGELSTNCAVPGARSRVRVCVTQDSKPGPSLGGPDAVCHLLRAAKDADRESFYVIYLDSQNRVNGIEEAHKGTVAAVEVHPREVFKGALAANATAIILAHNHPSGSKVQSHDDVRLTDRLVQSGQLLGIPVLDHIVVAREGCTSIREKHGDLFDGVETLKKRK